MIKRFILIIIVTMLLFGGLFGWKFYQISRAMSNFQTPPPAVVAITEVKQTLWQPYINTVGSLKAAAGVNVSNEVAGKIKAIYFKSGEKVKKRQVLVELDAAIEYAELQGLKADEQLARVRFDRSEKLIAKQYTSKSDYDLNKALLSQAKALVAAKQESINKKRIYAPFSGELGIRLVDVGQYLEEGASIVSLQTLEPIYADFTVPEAHLANLKTGQKLSLSVQAYPGLEFTGEITAINPEIEIKTRSVKIRATLANPEHRLHPGMFADVRILLSDKRAVLTLPDTAITYNPYGDSVFVVNSGKEGLTVQIQQVTTGESRNGRVEIIKGLTAGQRIVGAGQVKLRNGMVIVADNKAVPGERESE